ncbi:MAG: hypothetical protein ACFUZC_03910 [Chthoniobacteraceae bacterium]
MKRKRYTPEEIIKKLREAEGLVATGKSVEEASRAIEVPAKRFPCWSSFGVQSMRTFPHRNALLHWGITTPPWGTSTSLPH